MSLHAHPKPEVSLIVNEIPGLAYFSAIAESAKPVAGQAKAPHPLDSLNLMYAYYAAE